MTYDFMMYRIMIVALAQNYHIALVSWTLLIICCNKDPTDLLRNLITNDISILLCNTNL